MPELPEVETVCKGLQPFLVGQKIRSFKVRRRDLRLPVSKGITYHTKNRTITSLERRAKYILWHLDDDYTVIIHLGMSGHVKILQNFIPQPTVHDHIEVTINNGTVIRYNDPRRFGLVLLEKRNRLNTHRLLKNLGPDPLGRKFDHHALSKLLINRKLSIKNALLNQKIIAGLGNIYVSECLFVSGIRPMRPANSLKYDEIKNLVKAIRAVLRKAIELGGSSISDHKQPDGKLGYFQNQFNVYGKSGVPCLKCSKSKIKKILISGRSSFFCPVCQK